MTLLFITLFFAALVIWAAGGIHYPYSSEDKIFRYSYNEKKIPSDYKNENIKLNVMTWNISYGHGVGSAGDLSYEPIREEKLKEHLNDIIKIVQTKDVDILLLQEVDYKSKRSCRLNELEYLAHGLNMPYAARSWSWDANYVPFPYWPMRRHFGKVFSGGAVLSRYKITQNHLLHYKKPKSKPFFYNLFYLFRYTQTSKISLSPRHSFTVQNSHLEAFDLENRDEQARAFKQNMMSKKLGQSLSPILFAGDFNANAFEEGNLTYALLESLEGYKDVTPIQSLTQGEKDRIATFPSDAPSLKLDYIYVKDSVDIESSEVIRTGECSDHLPIFASLQVPIKLLESQA